MIKKTIRYITSLGLITLALTLGTAIQHGLGISIPGSIIGMLILFSAMVSGLVSPEWVKPSANIFIRYMILLFIPISAGLIDHYQLLMDNAFPIIASAVGGTAIMLVFLAMMLEKILVPKK